MCNSVIYPIYYEFYFSSQSSNYIVLYFVTMAQCVFQPTHPYKRICTLVNDSTVCLSLSSMSWSKMGDQFGDIFTKILINGV